MVVDEDGDVVESYDYFPFGLASRTSGGSTIYKFTEKELDNETDFYYFGARYYDPEVGRWLSVDPKALNYPSLSPYHYTYNNPIRYIDPQGEDIFERIDNWLHGRGWRDDTIQENLDEGDYETAFNQAAEELGYDVSELKGGKIHYVKWLKGGRTKSDFTMEIGNADGEFVKTEANLKNTIVHEFKHVEQFKKLKAKYGDKYARKVASLPSYQDEIDAIYAQKQHSTWLSTTPAYQEIINNYESFCRDRLRYNYLP